MKRLLTEIRLLVACEARFGIPAAPTVAALVADYLRPSGPEPPPCKIPDFIWPESGLVNLQNYWRQVDKAQRA